MSVRHIVVIPSSPALIEGVSPHDEGSARLRQAARSILDTRAAAVDSIAVVRSAAAECRTELTGSLSAWAPGVELPRAQGGHLLGEIIARLLLGEQEQKITACAEEIEALVDAELVIVLADGPVTLTERAPGGFHPEAEDAQSYVRELLRGDAPEQWHYSALSEAGVLDPRPWRQLWTLREQATVQQLLAEDTTGGVGRFVAQWEMAA
ncbi:hypothetical protein [Corynebacterium sp. TAE3-ERU2]|uniref:hypothetical protein n=1 Tax=Corynebacterium sp. TAE3-ERU2 TaxID=2849497 RepID=UPI001C46FBA7|nr:hypothetical protein [Corynebacterium sp. TAE3-ERU2]MBV7301651.1 hypothetical protein [Corynebacterium sp. TAE3-ERU2]